ncbi:MAG: RpiB/LacA/LacB family sugar-phosphate isomerase, partial [Candidatus Colwellbacteria bacterium]|nr:RpiB/LacA/LacB family sugar-phosphate isomerase [Candidatus Colwellbacteria bacterium]
MIIYIGADHRGFKLKETLKQFLQESGYTVSDLGNTRYEEGDDYPDFAKLVGQKVSADALNSRGIVICGSGVGVDVVANKFPNVRAALIHNLESAPLSREHNDANVLCLGSWLTPPKRAEMIVDSWINT